MYTLEINGRKTSSFSTQEQAINAAKQTLRLAAIPATIHVLGGSTKVAVQMHKDESISVYN